MTEGFRYVDPRVLRARTLARTVEPLTSGDVDGSTVGASSASVRREAGESTPLSRTERQSGGLTHLPTASSKKETGIVRALAGAGSYADDFAAAFARIPIGATFTSEDVTADAGLPQNEDGSVANGPVGALMNALARKKRVVRVGYRSGTRPESHGAALSVWKRVS